MCSIKVLVTMSMFINKSQCLVNSGFFFSRFFGGSKRDFPPVHWVFFAKCLSFFGIYLSFFLEICWVLQKLMDFFGKIVRFWCFLMFKNNFTPKDRVFFALSFFETVKKKPEIKLKKAYFQAIDCHKSTLSSRYKG